MRNSGIVVGIIMGLTAGAGACSLVGGQNKAAEPKELAEPPRLSKKLPSKRQNASRQSDSKESKNPFEAQLAERTVGDYFVHSFSGSHFARPFTLTEEVIAQKDGLWLIDYTFEEPEHTTQIRTLTDPESGAIVRAYRLEGDAEIELSEEALARLFDKTVFAPDINEKQLSSEEQTCVVGPTELDCELRRYRVIVEDTSAVLSVARSAQLSGRDVSGEIRAEDGSVMYRAELLEFGNDGGLTRSLARSTEGSGAD